MIKLPSIQQGYARSAGESEYPELWKGLEFAWVPGMQNSGNRLHDFSGKNTNGTLTNTPTWKANGRYGRGLNFAENAQHVVSGVTHSGLVDLPITQHFWICAWVNPTLSVAGTLIRKHDAGANGWVLAISASGQMQLTLSGYSTDDYRSFSSTGVLTANVWQHIAVGWDGSLTNGSRFFVNGSQVNTDFTNSGSGSYVSDANQFIYLSNFRTADDFSGSIDDIKIYSNRLSSTLLNKIYTVPYGPFIPRKRIYGFTVGGPVIFPPNSLALTGAGR